MLAAVRASFSRLLSSGRGIDERDSVAISLAPLEVALRWRSD
jgi:hypothetical protein